MYFPWVREDHCLLCVIMKEKCGEFKCHIEEKNQSKVNERKTIQSWGLSCGILGVGLHSPGVFGRGPWDIGGHSRIVRAVSAIIHSCNVSWTE